MRRGCHRAMTMLVVAGALAMSGRVQSQPGSVTAAQAELQALGNALDTCALTTLYYVSLETLNDINFAQSPPTIDYLNFEGGTFVIPTALGRFSASRINLLTAPNAWSGPYINYQPNRVAGVGSGYDVGSPLDPWGRPYLFFSPFGLLRGDTGSVTLEYYGDAFDRYTLVSLGQDGVVSSDDLWRQFGGTVSSFAVSSLRGPVTMSAARGPVSRAPGKSAIALTAAGEYTAPAGAEITIRGLNFGSVQTDATVWHGARQLTDVRRWSDREIDVRLPAGSFGPAGVVVKRGAATTNSIVLTAVEAPACVDAAWTLYE